MDINMFKIPKEVEEVGETLEKAGFKPYLVGGCVRDLLLGRGPKDWDIATDAKPEEVRQVFPDSVYENEFGTVMVRIKNQESRIKGVEVTTFRKDGKYSDFRRPDEVVFAHTIEEDLGRRDFTINAMALRIKNNELGIRGNEIVDPYGGQKDLEAKLIRAVGEPDTRFREDALRLMRAVRFAAELGWEIEERTAAAIVKHKNLLKEIAVERIRDEFLKIIASASAMHGVQMLEDLGIMQFIIPELREGIGCAQNYHHTYEVWEHNLRALDYAVEKGCGLEIRLASLFHDIGKPRTKRGEGRRCTFYGHEIVGARMVKKIVERLRFPIDLAERVHHLVRHHMFYYNVDEVSASGVRRLLSRVGVEYIDDLLKLREADRVGSRVAKAFPYKLRHLVFMIEKVRRDPISPKMLAINGDHVKEILSIPQSEKVGWVLTVLLDEVISDPKNNTKENLETRVLELGKLSDEKLQKMAREARARNEEAEEEEVDKLKQRHWVK